jgi:hypothetical protein
MQLELTPAARHARSSDARTAPLQRPIVTGPVRELPLETQECLSHFYRINKNARYPN